jgi:hypothetical protein
METKLAVFHGSEVRKILYNNEWWFSVLDVCAVMTESADPGAYWRKLKQRLKREGCEVAAFCHGLKLTAPDEKQRETDCVSTEGLFRIIQSIPSPRAETFKHWLAKVGYERVREIDDPELSTKRTKALYQAKGYSDDWIGKRMRGIAIHDELTDEWKKRQVGQEKEYAILTGEISRATFGLTPSEYKDFKGLERENLRDHMNDLELIFSMLGEAATTEITKAQDARGFTENRTAARKGGMIAGNARENLEKETKQMVVSKENYLAVPEKRKRVEKK